jgi:UDP-N-acetylmuramyl pentapeptide phosphotransferase/UDP-N-acetylglucosamine-1-phosphate transferase
MFDGLAIFSPYLPWMVLLSILSLVLVIALLPAIVVQLPEDYFVRRRRLPIRHKKGHPILIGLFNLIKNLLGLLFIVTGIVMTVLPGQGLLTILIGMMLANFPGKYRMEQALIKQPLISSTLNKLRQKASKKPFEIPPGA